MDAIRSASSGLPGVAGAGGTAAAAGNAGADKEMFLQLLVAQLRNQNPLDPTDPMQFVSQLSQFTSLEQLMAVRSELSAIHETLRGGQGEAATGPTEAA